MFFEAVRSAEEGVSELKVVVGFEGAFCSYLLPAFASFLPPAVALLPMIGFFLGGGETVVDLFGPPPVLMMLRSSALGFLTVSRLAGI